MTKIVTGSEGATVKIELGDIRSIEIGLKSSLLEDAVDGELDEELTEVSRFFQHVLEFCLEGAQDSAEVRSRLYLVKGFLGEARLRLLYSTLVLPKVTFPEDLSGIPVEIYNTPLESAFSRDARGLEGSVARRLVSHARRNNLEPILGVFLLMSTDALSAVRDIGKKNLDFYHNRLEERGWLQYARSRPSG